MPTLTCKIAIICDNTSARVDKRRLSCSCRVTDGFLPREVENFCVIENAEVRTTARLRPALVSIEQVVILNDEFVPVHLENYTLGNLCGADQLVLTDVQLYFLRSLRYVMKRSIYE